MHLQSFLGIRLLLFISVGFIISCSTHSSKDQELFKVFDERLEQNNKALSTYNEAVYASLVNKLSDPVSLNVAQKLQPKALLTVNYSYDLYSYIEELKNTINKKALNRENNNIEEVNTFFEKEGKGYELFDKLNNYKTDILNIDSVIKNKFGAEFTFLPHSITLKNNSQDFSSFYFHNRTPLESLVILTHFQNIIKLIEYKVLGFYSEHIQTHSPYEGIFSVGLITQSSTYIRPSEYIEITAGVGYFINGAIRAIQINDKVIPLGHYGYAVYKVKAANKIGKHIIPVKISYIDQDGKQQVIDKNVEYTVAKE